jgi:uncharacterized PurR-regulated membrane protein YhhQ (DUF165 family)
MTRLRNAWSTFAVGTRFASAYGRRAARQAVETALLVGFGAALWASWIVGRKLSDIAGVR